MILNIDKYQEIIHTISQNKLRTFLTGFSVSWGIFMLVLLLGSGTGVENGMKRSYKRYATNSITLYSGQTTIPYKGYQSGRNIQFTNSDFHLIKKDFKGVDRITGTHYMGNDNLVSYKNEIGRYSLQGCYPDRFHLSKMEIVSGRMINALDLKEFRKVVIVNQQLQKELGKGESLLGEYIQIRGVTYKVVGVYANEGRQRGAALIPVTTLQKFIAQEKTIQQISFTMDSSIEGKSKELGRNIREFLATRHQFSKEDPRAVITINNFENYQRFLKYFQNVRLFIWFIGIGSIIAGIIGVSNIMLIIVKERTGEIGLRKALGATPWSIIDLVMTESILITLFFGYLGLVVGVFGLEMVSRFMPKNEYLSNPSIDLKVAFGGLFLLIFFGALAGFFPARKAAMIKPVAALRDE